ncbi:hypothetical protein [Streptomyces sp. NPDC059916]|uniref:hypothetical protein n=1 Tax=Streptomyces sp. NPDC059916 TaxID=3347001 RepID=UPI0036AE8570
MGANSLRRTGSCRRPPFFDGGDYLHPKGKGKGMQAMADSVNVQDLTACWRQHGLFIIAPHSWGPPGS